MGSRRTRLGALGLAALLCAAGVLASLAAAPAAMAECLGGPEAGQATGAVCVIATPSPTSPSLTGPYLTDPSTSLAQQRPDDSAGLPWERLRLRPGDTSSWMALTSGTGATFADGQASWPARQAQPAQANRTLEANRMGANRTVARLESPQAEAIQLGETGGDDPLSTLLPRLGGVVARLEPSARQEVLGADFRIFGAQLSGALPLGPPLMPQRLSFGAHRQNDGEDIEDTAWVGSNWLSEAGQLELDVGLHRTDEEDSLTLGAAWRLSPLPTGRLSLEADADLAQQPFGRLLLEGSLRF